MKGWKSEPPGRHSILTHEQALDERRQPSEEVCCATDGVSDRNLLGELGRTVSRALSDHDGYVKPGRARPCVRAIAPAWVDTDVPNRHMIP